MKILVEHVQLVHQIKESLGQCINLRFIFLILLVVQIDIEV